jgi:hypothetical protein
VGVFVGEGVGVTVGNADGASVGAGVGDGVGIAVGGTVGELVVQYLHHLVFPSSHCLQANSTSTGAGEGTGVGGREGLGVVGDSVARVGCSVGGGVCEPPFFGPTWMSTLPRKLRKKSPLKAPTSSSWRGMAEPSCERKLVVQNTIKTVAGQKRCITTT